MTCFPRSSEQIDPLTSWSVVSSQTAEGGGEASLVSEEDARPAEEGAKQVLVACGSILAPNGDVLTADGTICAAMSDALMSAVAEEDVARRAVTVSSLSKCNSVSYSPTQDNRIDNV